MEFLHGVCIFKEDTKLIEMIHCLERSSPSKGTKIRQQPYLEDDQGICLCKGILLFNSYLYSELIGALVLGT